MKTCSACGRTAAPDEFYAGSAACKDCVRARVAKHHAANKEARNAYNRAYHAANRERLNAYSREYRAARKAENPEYESERYAAHADKRREYARQKGRRRSLMLRLLRETAGCADCATHDGLLHLHHENPEDKNFAPSRGYRKPLRVLFAEVEKCVVLCAPCHAVRHRVETRGTIKP